jgi:hypothetical protein
MAARVPVSGTVRDATAHTGAAGERVASPVETPWHSFD